MVIASSLPGLKVSLTPCLYLRPSHSPMTSRISKMNHICASGSMMSSLAHHDEPDPFKILFLKGPKHKHLAKVCISAYICCSSSLTVLSVCSVSNRPVMPAIKANTDVMVLVSLTLFFLLTPALNVLQAQCSNWYLTAYPLI